MPGEGALTPPLWWLFVGRKYRFNGHRLFAEHVAFMTDHAFDDVATLIIFFFFQAEDGIRDVAVTGVQTCALPIYGFDSVPTAQLLVKRPFDSDHPSEIRHPVIEEDIVVGRRIIALQMTEQMSCRDRKSVV